MKNYLWLPLIALILLAIQSPGMARETQTVQQKMTAAIKTEASAQAKADDWTGSKADLVNEIRDLQTRLVWLQYQKSKHEIYVRGVTENIADLEQRKLEARKLRENLEPYLEEVVARLENFTLKDLPFLVDERHRRLNFLKTTLNDYHLDLGEKLRRVFEALSVEATYGKMVTSSDETIALDGEDTEVTVFRLGRMAMYYRSLDGQKLGIFNPDTGLWQAMDPSFSKDLRHALEMARRERTAQLIQLPLGAQ